MHKTILLILIVLWALFSAVPNAVAGENPAKTIVFVHGAWGGGWDYRNLETMLEKRGHYVHRVTLTGQGERAHLLSADINLDTHIMDVVNVLKYDDLENVILVGHSYGGMVITGVAHRVPGKIRRLVYIDAWLPENGESAFSFISAEEKARYLKLADEQGNGISIPPFWPDWGKDVPHPLGTWQQPILLGNAEAEKLPATYVLTIEDDAESDDFSQSAKRARQRGWDYLEWNTGHNAQRTMPNVYVEMLDGLE